MKYNQIPTEPHYAALVTKSTYIPGDERSRQAPGHGYPAHTQLSIDYIAFESEAEMQGWAQKREAQKYGGDAYRIIKAEPLTVQTKVEVKVS